MSGSKARAVVVSGNGAETCVASEFSEWTVPSGPRQFERAGGQAPDVQSRLRRAAQFEHELNEYKSVQVTRIPAYF